MKSAKSHKSRDEFETSRERFRTLINRRIMKFGLPGFTVVCFFFTFYVTREVGYNAHLCLCVDVGGSSVDNGTRHSPSYYPSSVDDPTMLHSQNGYPLQKHRSRPRYIIPSRPPGYCTP